MQLSAIKFMMEIIQVLVIACNTALTSECHGDGPHPASWRAASVADQSNKLVMDPSGLLNTKVLRRTIPWTVKRQGRPAPNDYAPAYKSEVGNDLHIWELASPADIVGRMI
jgi:hypothetical protein